MLRLVAESSNLWDGLGDDLVLSSHPPSFLPRVRNTSRGLRSPAAVTRRTSARSARRATARRRHRRGIPPPLGGQDPTFISLGYGRMICIGTLNVRGVIRAGLREEVDAYMLAHNIDLLIFNETHSLGQAVETRASGYSW